MTKRMFTVSAIWDDEAKVYYCKSDIIGLNIEAETLDEFEIAIADAAPFLVLANHLTKDELARSALEDLIPIILWQRPISQAAA